MGDFHSELHARGSASTSSTASAHSRRSICPAQREISRAASMNVPKNNIAVIQLNRAISTKICLSVGVYFILLAIY